MPRLQVVRLLSGVLVALLGLIVVVCSYVNVGCFADLGETASRLGDDGTAGSLVSFVAGLLLVGLGAFGATSSFFRASTPRETKSPASPSANRRAA